MVGKVDNMKWSYTGGKINVSSHEEEQQFLLKELIEEADKHRAKKQKIIIFFIFLSLTLLVMQSYGANLEEGITISDDIALYFYIGCMFVCIKKRGNFLPLSTRQETLNLSLVVYYPKH